MSLYIFDTDIFTLWCLAHPVVCQRARLLAPSEVAVTIITVEEQWTGWYTRLRRVRQRDALARTYQRVTDAVSKLAGLPIISFAEPAILRYEQLRAMRLNIGGFDLRIAAIALEGGAILVTRNLRDFQRVPNLVLEDWSV